MSFLVVGRMIELTGYDTELFRFINGLSGHSSFIDEVLSIIASDYLMPVVTGSILLYLWLTAGKSIFKRYNVILCLLSMAVATSIVFVCNVFYYRERPFMLDDVNVLFYMPTDSSFPSNIAAGLSALSLPIALTHKKLCAGALICCLLVCLSRVYVGIHYPLDIIAGFFIGFGSFFIVKKLFKITNPINNLIILVTKKLRLV